MYVLQKKNLAEPSVFAVLKCGEITQKRKKKHFRRQNPAFYEDTVTPFFSFSSHSKRSFPEKAEAIKRENTTEADKKITDSGDGFHTPFLSYFLQNPFPSFRLKTVFHSRLSSDEVPFFHIYSSKKHGETAQKRNHGRQQICYLPWF